MQKTNTWTRAAVLFALALVLGTGSVIGGDKASKEAKEDMEWGYKAARRGYWQLALDRFQHANELTPGQVRILNNIAVAEEASGLFEEANLTYQTALAIAPNDRILRRNYMRFQEFYASYLADPEESEDEEEGEDKNGENTKDRGEDEHEGADDA